MNMEGPNYRRHRYPAQIIGHAVWLYHCFSLSFRDVEDLLAEVGVFVSYETIRQWYAKFGPANARALKKRSGRLGDTWLLDEVFVTIRGERCYLCRAVNQDGDTLDILVQRRRDRRAAARFFRKLLKGEGRSPRRLVTSKLRSYSAAKRETMPSAVHDTKPYANNRAELSHQPTREREREPERERERERKMRRFKSPGQAQRFLAVHAVVGNLWLSSDSDVT
jgi:putative transposase